jgi:hypothetical protein
MTVIGHLWMRLTYVDTVHTPIWDCERETDVNFAVNFACDSRVECENRVP